MSRALGAWSQASAEHRNGYWFPANRLAKLKRIGIIDAHREPAMSDDDELASLLSSIESDSDDAASSSDTESDAGGAVVEEYQMEITSTEEISMSSDDDSTSYDSQGSTITQAEVYDNLKRISELEDERQAIQEELKNRTNQLRSMLKHIDRGSILYKMLVSALPGQERDSAPARAPKAAAKPAGKAKKSPRKKAATQVDKPAPAKKKAVKKKTSKKAPRR